MKNKRGFTLVELLAAIVVILILSLLATPKVQDIINGNRNKSYKEIERRLEEAASKYIVEEYISYNSNTVTITKDELIAKKYIDDVYDLKDKTECDAYVVVSNLSGMADFDAVLDCSNYQSVPIDDNDDTIKLIVQLNGGIIDQQFDTTYQEGDVIELNAPIKTGIDFAGWVVITGDATLDGNTLTMGKTSSTIYAMWSNETTIEVLYEGGSSNQQFSSSYLSGTTIELKTPNKSGYTFAGWEKVSGDGVLSGNNVTFGLLPVVVKAKWTVNTYAVTFNTGNRIYDLNDVSNVEGPLVNYSINNGVITVTSKNDEGYGELDVKAYLEAGKEYTFNCDVTGDWGFAPGQGKAVAFLLLNKGYELIYGMESNRNFKFTPTQSGVYYLRLDVHQNGKTHTFSNIGITTTETKNVTYDSTYQNLPTPTRTGYIFKGWFIGNTEIKNGDKVAITSDSEAVAKWEANTYDIYLIGNSGSIPGGTTLTNMVTNGSFENGSDSWNLSNASVTTEQKYTGNNSVKLNAGGTASSSQVMAITAPSLNHKYYGRTMFLSSSNFTVDDNRFEWFYNDDWNVGKLIFANKSAQITSWMTYSKILTQTSSTYLGYEWRIRNFVVNSSTASYVDDVMVIDLTNSYGAGNEMTDLSVLDKIPYFENNESIYKKSVEYGSSYNKLPTPSRSGYTFDGWYTAVTGGTKVTSISTVDIAENHELYARWR